MVRQAHQPPNPSRNLQAHFVHIRVTLLEAEGYVEGIGFFAPGARGEVEIDGREFAAGEVDDALEEGAADALAAVGGQDYDVLDTRLTAGGRFVDAQGGAADDVLFVVLRDEDPGSRRSYRALLLLRRDGQLGVQLFHKGQQIIDLGAGQGAKFKVSHSVKELGFVDCRINLGIICLSTNYCGLNGTRIFEMNLEVSLRTDPSSSGIPPEAA